ncbi:MAG: M20/M25/M40 family metallo-hydrolase [Planctomycetes bacterium]|nr:M20/M25/M40 family metallo-hydrolase [Planctomycetota bacterium]
MQDILGLVDEKRSKEILLDFLKIEGPSGSEKAVAGKICEILLEAGAEESNITFDDANKQMPDPTETGNLFVRLPGKGRPRLLAAHMDTVPLAVGVKPKTQGVWITSSGRTALGADDRGGVAVLVATAEALLESGIDHPPVTFLFTVREEGGTWGARFVDQVMLGDAEMGFSFDGREPDKLVIAAPSSDKFTITIRGKESHAGTAPERGVSAMEIAAVAVSALRKKGWFGKITRAGGEGTSNIGAIEGGAGSNVVMGSLQMQAETRSHDPEFLGKITKAYKVAFRQAAKAVKNVDGETGTARFKIHRAYNAFHLSPNSPAVAAAAEAIKTVGLNPGPKVQNGGLDACWLNEYGIPTVTLGSGTYNAHTKQERLNLPDYLNACRVALLLATLPFDESSNSK